MGERDAGFVPVNPWRAAELEARKRNLPHLQTPRSTYFVSFRCRTGIQLPAAAREAVLSAIRHWDGGRIELDAAVVMPDHAHAIFRIVDGSALDTILHSIKSFSAQMVNRALGRSGRVWVEESFDHIVRDERRWEEKIAYVRDNPVKRGLVSRWQDYAWTWIRK